MKDIERRIEKVEQVVQKGQEVAWIFLIHWEDDGGVSMEETLNEIET